MAQGIFRAALAWLVVSSLWFPLCAASENRPFLRLNPTMHTEMINRSDVGADGLLLATVSDDKTIRLWELPSGRLFRVLRPPIGMGNEGKLFSVALSPHNLLVAAGGWAKAGYRGFGNHNVYLFDGSNSEIINRISGLENVALHLDFSPDAQYQEGEMSGYLACALADGQGLRVWRLSNLTEVLRDMDYESDSYWAEFSPDGKLLASSSYDGYIRLYEWEEPVQPSLRQAGEKPPKMHLRKRVKLKEQTSPFSVRFSPDSQKIAVGFTGASKVAILSAKDLSLLSWTDTGDGGTGDLFLNAWSPDGKLLYGAGGYRKEGMQAVVRWLKGGAGAPASWPAAWNTMMGLHPLADQQVIYVSSAPEWGILDAKGRKILDNPNESVYFNKIFPQGLSVSEDAQIIQFEHDTLERKKLLRFSLAEQRLFEVIPEAKEVPADTPPATTPAPAGASAVSPASASKPVAPAPAAAPTIAPAPAAKPAAPVPAAAPAVSPAPAAKPAVPAPATSPTQAAAKPVAPVPAAAKAPATAGANAAPAPAPPTMTLREAQQRLIAKKLFEGPADNLMGRKTRAALKAFQQSANLPQSGVLDAATIAAFLAEDAAKAAKIPEVSPPTLTAPDLEIKSWKNSDQPQLNGKPLALAKNDTSISYAFSPTGDALVLGTRFRLYHYSKEGKLKWQKNTPGIVWAVNIAGNGKILVAAFSDGTLRWFKLEDGEELMAFYPHADGRRWLAWTPDGLYAASVGADKLAGWHVNNQPDQSADFYPLGSLRESYYQPQTLVQILADIAKPPPESNVAALLAEMDGMTGMSGMSGQSGGAEAQPKTEKEKWPENFPPRVLLQSPKDGSPFSNSEIELVYQLRFHGKPEPSELRLMIDGRPLKTIKASEQADPLQGKLPLSLPRRNVELSLIAKNAQGISPPELVLLLWKGEQAAVPLPALYILSVGVSDYTDDNVGDLPFAHSDADAFGLAWAGQTKYYREIKVNNLPNGGYNQIIEGFEWLRKESKAEDTVLVFFSGHSLQHRDSRKNTYFFLPADATATSNTVSTTILLEALGSLPGKVALFVDTAHFDSLGAAKSDLLSPSDVNGFANELTSPENGLIVFSSSVGTQSSQWGEKGGLFVSALAEALAGKGDGNNDGQVMLKEVAAYVSTRVGELSQGKQTPVLAMPETIVDFQVASAPVRKISDNNGGTTPPSP